LNEDLEFTTVESLQPKQRNINLRVKAILKNEEKTVVSRRDNSEHRVCNVLIGDETACINLVLWDDQIDEVQLEKTYEITNSYITIFNNSMQVSLGKYGNLQEIDADITPNTDNNLSDRFVERPRYYQSSSYSGSNYGRGSSGYSHKRRPYSKSRKRY